MSPLSHSTSATTRAYRHCAHIARTHYENFPVASHLLPAHLRRYVSAIYAFARSADDIADEGDCRPAQRLAQLAEFAQNLDSIEANTPLKDPLFIALADTIERNQLPIAEFRHLLHAFAMDVKQVEYASFAELLGYCRYSASPIGRLLLHMLKQTDAPDLMRSDQICSALQLINFYQDSAQDFNENGRIYLPQDEMRNYGVTRNQFQTQHSDTALRKLMHKMRLRAQALLLNGASLALDIPGRFGWELRFIVCAGLRVLQRLSASHDDVFARPRLGRLERLQVLSQTLHYRRLLQRQQPALAHTELALLIEQLRALADPATHQTAFEPALR